MKMDVSIIVPAFNEEASLGQDIDKIKKGMDCSDYSYEIIVVNDASQDNTAAIAREKGVILLEHKINKGYGASLKSGIKAAKGEVIVITDADNTYPNDEIPSLLKFMNDYDMVVGQRLIEAGSIKILRKPTKWFIRKLASYLVEFNIPDLNSGLRAFKKDLALRYFYLLPDGFSWTSTITMAFLSDKLLVKYVPIDYFKRKGKSSFHPIKDTYNYLRLVVRTLMYFNPLKMFIPFSFFLFSIGFVKLWIDFSRNGYVGSMAVMTILTSFLLAALGLIADLIVVSQKRNSNDI